MADPPPPPRAPINRVVAYHDIRLEVERATATIRKLLVAVAVNGRTRTRYYSPASADINAPAKFMILEKSTNGRSRKVLVRTQLSESYLFLEGSPGRTQRLRLPQASLLDLGTIGPNVELFISRVVGAASLTYVVDTECGAEEKGY